MPIEYGPDPACAHPNPSLKRICFIKNTVSRPNIVIGDYTYYDDPEDSENFEAHVTHHYDFIGDKLIIGKFTAIAKGVEFVMNEPPHGFRDHLSVQPYASRLGKSIPALDELPLKGDTVVGNDVWIGQNVTVLPGVHIGDGAIIGADSVVAKDIPPYTIAAGNPCRVIRKRFDDELIEYLLALKWWDWDAEKIFRNMEILCSADPSEIKNIDNR